MFIIKFQGALGNQMFEYVFMRQIEKHYPGCDVYAHIPKIKDFNGYELESIFSKIKIKESNIRHIEFLSYEYPDKGKCYKIMSFIYRVNRALFGPKRSHYRQDDNTFFYPEVYELNPLQSYYLDGVWANAHYLIGMDDEIRETFVFPGGRGEQNEKYLEDIENSNSICIHVRRNEYVSMGLSVVSDDYYKRAVKHMLEKVNNPKFFVFSDDHEYCKKLFNNMIEYTLVEGNVKKNSFRDMELMSHCKHNIIANSTFSFWGAYLNANENKIVIAPNITWGNLRCPFACDDWIIMNI